jgi:hypothetical protein
MKLKYFIGISFFLLVTVGVASAADYPLTICNLQEDGTPASYQIASINVVNVNVATDSSGGGIITFTAKPSDDILKTYPNLHDGITKIGFPSTITLDAPPVTDDVPNKGTWVDGGLVNEMGGFKVHVWEYHETQIGNDKPNIVTVHFTGGTISDSPVFVAHVVWDKTIVGASSCFYSNTTQRIPEFPSMILPVAAILGILIIFGRRKSSE